MPNCPPLIKQVEQALSKFSRPDGGKSASALRPMIKTEVMDEFSSKGWERGEHMALLELQQSPSAILGVVLERKRILFIVKETLLMMIMVEKSVSAPSETVTTWQPVVSIVSPTVASLVETLGHLLEDGFLVRAKAGLAYTGKRIDK